MPFAQEPECGFGLGPILTECGHENALFSGRTIYILGLLQLLRSKLLAERIVRYFDVLVSEGFLRSVY